MKILKIIAILFLSITPFSCGLGTPDNNLETVREKVETDAIFENDARTIKVWLVKAKDLGEERESQNYFALRIGIDIPVKRASSLSKRPDSYFIIKLTNFKSDNKELVNKSLYFLFGDLNKSSKFLVPQKSQKAGEIGVVNFNFIQHLFEVPQYTKAFPFMKNTLSLQDTVFKITNKQDGCAMYCEGETSIQKEVGRYGFNAYIFKILLFTKKQNPKATRLKEKWSLSLGYMDRQNKKIIFSKKNIVLLDFDIENEINFTGNALKKKAHSTTASPA